MAANDDLLGHGVNIAARLMQMAEPNSAVLSQAVETQLREVADIEVKPLGRVQLDKMSERVAVYAIAGKDVRFGRVAWRRWRHVVYAAASMFVLVIAGIWLSHALQPPTPRLAVLRFQSVGGTESYFSEGVVDELIAEVSRIQGMEVSARASSFALAGPAATPANAARQLGATLVLTGSVRRFPDKVHVDAELVEAPGGRRLWTRGFERPSNEASLLERDIAIRVAQAADARITAPPPQRVDADAYRLYLQGREQQLGVADTGWAVVRDRYAQAVARDPHFAEAWAALARADANVEAERVDNAGSRAQFTVRGLAPAFADADRAIALDNSLADPFLVRALADTWLGRWRLAAQAAAEGEHRGGSAGNFYRALGYMHEAEEARKRSTGLDPLSATEWNNLAYTCEYNADVECQLDAAQRAHDLAPDNISATRGLVRALIANHRGDDAYRLLQIITWLHDPSLATRILVTLAGHGSAPTTAEILSAFNNGDLYIDTAITDLGDLQRWSSAAALLDRWGPSARSTIFALFRAQWAPLRRTPQFWALMQREGLVQYWRESRHWPDFCESEPVCAPYRT